MTLEERIKKNKLSDEASYSISVSELKKLGISEKNIFDLVKKKDPLVTTFTAEDIRWPIKCYLMRDLDKIERLPDSDDDLDKDFDFLLELIPANEISDIGTSSYFFETFSDNTDYDLQENGGPEIVEVHRELLIIINEALD